MRIVWIGFHEEGIKALEGVLSERIKIHALITLNQLKMKERSASTHAYRSICERNGISYYEVDSIKSETAYNLLKNEKPDLVIVLGWSEILPARLLEIPSIGTVGTHAAMLPHNRGSAPVNWAILRGETTGGNTLMWLNEKVDSGKMIEQISFPITIYDTCKTVYDKVSKTNDRMIRNLIARLLTGEKVPGKILPELEEELLPRRKPKDGLICWEQPAKQIYDFVRALTEPYPGAFSYLNGDKWMIWKCSFLSEISLMKRPGEIIGNIYSTEKYSGGIAVACSSGMICIHEMENEAYGKIGGKEITELGVKGIFEQ